MGVERLTLLDPQQGAVPSVSARHTLSRYLRGMGFCPRMVPVDGIKCMHPRGRGFCPRLLASSQALDASIESLRNEGVQSRLASMQSYANVFYNWHLRAFQWEQFLESLLDEDRALPESAAGYFEYTA